MGIPLVFLINHHHIH